MPPYSDGLDTIDFRGTYNVSDYRWFNLRDANTSDAAIEAIAKGQNRILLVMATGTGKTYTAFQIIWRLWKAGRKKRILFLADRNILADQMEFLVQHVSSHSRVITLAGAAA